MTSKRTRGPTPSSIGGDPSIHAFEAAQRQPYFLGSEDITDSVDWVRGNRGGWILVETGSGKGGDPLERRKF
ncbi:hypothetical protein EWM64_g4624 [Hericium alpestre]|uniref:Uncharacterized protein n=1 Tax=Hericium alpestre TaxID=135208 RepID=A0A4Y9ZZJ1_9AGAM|nr:hypothetical protein EWM64_g4624 [Hericium alpestre]